MRGEADMMTGPARDWEEVLATLGPIFCERAAKYDSSDAFVAENYADPRLWTLLRLDRAGVFDAPACDRHRVVQPPSRQTR